ncbi:MAG: hypothetical protein HOD43_13095 [Candidatus Marinimicrobia bacterium]|nr:hypothetical protein [Candidatus Neomarinimicrobiota bacterium]MBT3631881.1 hypothetical protein [Candidatus Neomarinimicrobiota bacterium]MBT3824440.1 hypothetical protein [Candidatus Neomarinimicrobiota bacterium]MBT4296730.1 hypothetical protein [Candidatus Neomarinimicrobiota bacterium]MBT4418900.1 hypothetical protein [Candidatus Neomarinimicrobiota bacterium]
MHILLIWLKKWFFRWSFIDIPVFGVGVGLIIYYINSLEGENASSVFIESIVPNIGTELLGVWLSVRIIESVLRVRQKRSRLRAQLIDNMNYLITLTRSIAPHFEQQTIDHLSSELLWFEEMKDYRISGISEQTINLINEVTKFYAQAATEATKINPLREDINDLFLLNPQMLDNRLMKELHDIYRRQNYTRIIVERIESRIKRYKERIDNVEQSVHSYGEKEIIQKIEGYSETLKVYIAITLDAEAAVTEARSAVLNREYNF